MYPFPVVSVIWAVSATVGAQLSGSVGPLTSYSDKANAKICDISDYGAVERLAPQRDLGYGHPTRGQLSAQPDRVLG